MEQLRLLAFCFVILTCEGGISRPQSKFLSQRKIAEITKIVEKKIAKELLKSTQNDEKDPIYVEPTPPDLVPSVENEIETIRQNISESSEGVECNITAGYLWELCRPVLLRTCKEKYRMQCSSTPRRYTDFSRRLNRMFPVFRVPEVIFKPQPLSEWFEKQVTGFTDAIGNSSNFQFSITITNNGKTRTYSNHDAAEDVANITRHFHQTLNDFRRRYRNLLPKFLSSEDVLETTNHLQKILNFVEDIRNDDEVEEVPALKITDNSALTFSNPSSQGPKRVKRSRMRSSRNRFLPRNMRGWRNRSWQKDRWIPSYHRQFRGRHPSHPIIRVPSLPAMEMWTPPPPVRPWHFFNHKPSFRNRAFPVVGIKCQQMEENPETCLEIEERKEKCENELEKVCPEYMETRRRIAEKLSDVYARQHQVSQVSKGDDDDEVNEKYEWATKFKGIKRPIVIESIKVTQVGSGDAFVRARLFDTVDVKLRVPGKDFDSSAESLGEAISKVALESIGTQRGDEP